MKIFQFLLTFSILILSTNNALTQSQLKVGGLSGSFGHIFNNESNLSTNLVGLIGSVEYPVKGISMRVEYGYFVPTESHKNNIPELEDIANINFYIGNIIRKGEPLQFPFFVGVGKTFSKGDLTIEAWGATARAEMRYYFSPRIALFTGVSANYAFASNQVYLDELGIEKTSNLNLIIPQFHIGVIYCYQK